MTTVLPVTGEVRRSIDLRLRLECVAVTGGGAALCRVVDNPRALPVEIPAELWAEYEAVPRE